MRDTRFITICSHLELGHQQLVLPKPVLLPTLSTSSHNHNLTGCIRGYCPTANTAHAVPCCYLSRWWLWYCTWQWV